MNLYHHRFSVCWLTISHILPMDKLETFNFVTSWVRKCQRLTGRARSTHGKSIKVTTKVYTVQCSPETEVVKCKALDVNGFALYRSCPSSLSGKDRFHVVLHELINTPWHWHWCAELWIRFQVSVYSSENKQGSQDPKVMCCCAPCTSHLISRRKAP